jgi:hypothetical protein
MSNWVQSKSLSLSGSVSKPSAFLRFRSPIPISIPLEEAHTGNCWGAEWGTPNVQHFKFGSIGPGGRHALFSRERSALFPVVEQTAVLRAASGISRDTALRSTGRKAVPPFGCHRIPKNAAATRIR